MQASLTFGERVEAPCLLQPIKRQVFLFGLEVITADYADSVRRNHQIPPYSSGPRLVGGNFLDEKTPLATSSVKKEAALGPVPLLSRGEGFGESIKAESAKPGPPRFPNSIPHAKSEELANTVFRRCRNGRLSLKDTAVPVRANVGIS